MLTAKEYLRQAYRLDQQINFFVTEIQNLRELATSVSALQYERDQIQKTPSTDPPFIKALEKVWDLEEKLADKLDHLCALKKQITTVIGQVENPDERLTLSYRYLQGRTWDDIGALLYVDERTARRWHGRALLHVVMPEDPIVLPIQQFRPQMSETAGS